MKERLIKSSCFALFFFLILASFHPNYILGNELSFAVNEWPPWKTTSPFDGIDIRIAKKIAARLNLLIKFKKCPWKRCLKMIELGNVDMLSSVIKKADREVYALFIEPPYLTEAATRFYILKNSGHQIQKYEDLYKLVIGITRGYRYFRKFDEDRIVKKVEVTNDIQLLKMLAAGRLDAFVSPEISADYLILKKGYSEAFKKTPFKINQKIQTYMILSKKSPHAKNLSQFNMTIRQMVEEGIIKEIVNSYFE